MKSLYIGASLCLALTAIGCGGGTTGTSVTGDAGELKLLGQASGADNQPAANKTMVVYSASEDKELAESETDAEGRFDMSLPGSEKSVVLEIDSETSAPLSRVYNGSSILNTFLFRQSIRQSRRAILFKPKYPYPDYTPDPNMPRKPPAGCACRKPGWRPSYMVRYTLEFSVNSQTLCHKLSTKDNRLYIEDSLDADPCKVEVDAFTEQFPLNQFRARLIGTCPDGARVISAVPADQQGRMVLDFADAFKQGCEALRIESFGSVGSERPITIPVIDKR